MAKQSRKDLLKREDAFIVAAEHSALWIDKHRKPLIAIGVAILLLGAGISAALHYLHQRDSEAAALFAEGWRIVDTGTVETKKADDKDKKIADKDALDAPPSFPSEKDKWLAARQPFADVVERAGYRGLGVMAAFMLGDLSEKLEDNVKAEATFVALHDHLEKTDPLYFLAAERAAYAREAHGDYDGAIAMLRDVRADDKYFYADHALFQEARLHLAKNQGDEARALLERIEKSFPSSSLSDEVQEKLAALGGNDSKAAPSKAAP